MSDTYYLIKIDLPDYSVFEEWLQKHNIEYRKVINNEITTDYDYDPDTNYVVEKSTN